MTQLHNRNIIWAVDPIVGEWATLMSGALAIKGMTKSTHSPVKPVCIWKSSPVEIPIASAPEFFEEVQRRGQEEIHAVLKKVKISGVEPLEVLTRSYVICAKRRKHSCNLPKNGMLNLLSCPVTVVAA